LFALLTRQLRFDPDRGSWPQLRKVHTQQLKRLSPTLLTLSNIGRGRASLLK
jgi:hypothetical protein